MKTLGTVLHRFTPWRWLARSTTTKHIMPVSMSGSASGPCIVTRLCLRESSNRGCARKSLKRAEPTESTALCERAA